MKWWKLGRCDHAIAYRLTHLHALLLGLCVLFHFLENVRDHRWLPVARPMPSERSESASGVQRVAIRCIALFGIIFFGLTSKQY
jgi:hypothetical protein